ncbi:putative aminoglycoside phosphotransferase [Actinoplanes missouriensis 431]|uniref:Putative aminoglycoside phosphotransferase n=1 Tax=Actinoplanes missouriensis (strain ATCC 14538 / DSM 43046 / CBS 188.64 / JCM 3121 / NBRC 102363 / NCIMB 12654 / NRRL B-3342 / UNCC 431) TaxID=512565 RepID=I0HJU9_ACTM4|nr:fructosamine kinase family protein [Actinoplanes missouriensis]BAL93286.1 putative aminoglycoside phosphotransferase [Actinoplanes missouriensis 431]
MDMVYLRAHPQHLPAFLTHQRIRETPVAAGVCTARRLTLDDGTSLFAKSWPSDPAPDGMFAAEAASLRWLRSAGAVPVPEVIVALPDLLALEWITPGSPTRASAEEFGRSLASLHRAGADSFGAAWPGWIGPLPLDNTVGDRPWGAWFATRRLLPYLRLSADRGALSGDDVTAVELILSTIDEYGGEERPARIHGDLWPGNLLWGADGRGWLVDPAAHGGHRETDLATLALFGGVPHLDVIIGAYREVWPLHDGWEARVPLHQLHLLLVHTAAFGSGYRSAVRATADAVLRA